jgi:NodT family efflux transporter outer membrane factor (OMF) lipoprotein
LTKSGLERDLFSGVADERKLLKDEAEEPLVRLLNATPEKRAIASAIACAILLFLTGCQIPKLALPEKGAPLPADFNGKVSAENSAKLSIEEFFNDPVLVFTIEQALASNQELKVLNGDVTIAANEILSRRGEYLPFVSFRGEAGLDKHSLYTPLGAAEEQLLYPPGKHFPDPLPNFLLGLDIFWRLDIWRELRNARDAAAQRYFAAIERRNYFVTTLVADVAENYYELLALDNRLEILDRIIGLQEQNLRFSEANKRAARGTDLPVQRFQAEVRKNQSEKLIVRQAIIETENRINFLAGRFPQPVERQSVDFINLNLRALNVGVPSQLLLYRRDIQQAERELAAAGLDVRVARARFFPRLDISGTVGYEAFNPRYLFNPDALIAEIAAGLVQPLINKKAIQADYLSANARQLQSVYNYQRVVLNAFTEVVNSLSKVENYRQSVELKKQQLDALETSVDVAGRLFQSARIEYVDVLFAQRDLLDARTLLIETKQQQLSAVVSAYQALGGGAWLSGLPQNPAGLEIPAPQPPPIEVLPQPAQGNEDDQPEKLPPGGDTAGQPALDGMEIAPPRIRLGQSNMDAGQGSGSLTLRQPAAASPESAASGHYAIAAGNQRSEMTLYNLQSDDRLSGEGTANTDLPHAWTLRRK